MPAPGPSQQSTVPIPASHPARKPIPFTPLSDVPQEDLKWLWKPYIPFRAITVVFGPGGIGKTTLLCSIAATLSTGGPLPNPKGGEVRIPPQRILMATAEDDPGMVLVPRMKLLGADMTRVLVAARPFTLDAAGLGGLEESLKTFNAAVLFIDPIVSFMGGVVDMDKANQVRGFMSPLAAIAKRTDTAIVLVHHSGKVKRKSRPQDNALGSVDFINGARSVLEVSEGSEGGRRMNHVKWNWSQKAPSIEFFTDEDGRFEWGAVLAEDGPTRMSPRPSVLKERAQQFIHDLLKNGPVSSLDVVEAAKTAGIAMRTLEKAKPGIAHSVKNQGKWYWQLDGRAGMGDVPSQSPSPAASPGTDPVPSPVPVRPSPPGPGSGPGPTNLPGPTNPFASAEDAAVAALDDVLTEARARAAAKRRAAP